MKFEIEIEIDRIMNPRLHHWKEKRVEVPEKVKKSRKYPPKHLGIISIPCNDYKRNQEIARNKDEQNALKRMNTMPNDPMPTLCCGKT